MSDNKDSFPHRINPDGTVNNNYVDVLDEDKPIAGQKFACVSFISPEKIIKQREMYNFQQFHDINETHHDLQFLPRRNGWGRRGGRMKTDPNVGVDTWARFFGEAHVDFDMRLPQNANPHVAHMSSSTCGATCRSRHVGLSLGQPTCRVRHVGHMS